MCEICMQSPCPAGCPNADEPQKVYTCEECKDGILEGEEYVLLEDGFFHFECLYNMSVKEIVKACGYKVETAEI